MKKSIIVIACLGIFVFGQAQAQQNISQPQVDYQGQPVVDLDLDGLTDQAELQIYKTDAKNPDTDNDGYYDGTEIVVGADPLDVKSIPGVPPADLLSVAQDQTPWVWYVSRVSGLVGFTLLYISIFLVLTIRVPFMRKIFAPAYALNAHGWIALQATVFALVHGGVLIFDKFLGFSLIDVFVPFAASYQPVLVALGTIGVYLMVILVATSYFRKHLPFKFWRAVHFLNIILYMSVIIHALYLGTDLKNPIFKDTFIAANEFLILLMLINMFLRIKENIVRKKAVDHNPTI